MTPGTPAPRRVALISGASRGIGAAIARELAANGWAVSLGCRDPATSALPDGEAVHVQPFDALEGCEAQWVAAALARFGRIDAVVNNAGISVPRSIIEAEEADLDLLLAVNLKSPFRLVRAAWPHLVATGAGRVVTIASLSGKRVKSARASLYAISKFAVVALSHGIRQCGAEAGVRATAICPGFVNTEMGLSGIDRAPDEITQPEDVARVVRLVLDLPNTAAIAEIPINWRIEDIY
ncbi:MAG: SDR family NAD(P)-dependent oxidoreductase [Thermohalobaculum sp.]|nr:SDR family NAD(P)-dependent oxidoreductase [Thermohalobaculum sp.]